ncbi:transposon Ty3-I Gag-Pol polyprotein [Trichonephila clavipes]|nr:transposon Ty3-I Gag-Pol polyprotein [Trichonephila clavipes]
MSFLLKGKKEDLLEEKGERIIGRERKRRDNLELEKLRIEAQIGLNQEILSRNNRTPSNELNKLLPKFDMKEDISLYLILFERQACMMNVPKEFWVSHLLGILPQDITQLIAREPEQDSRDYDHVSINCPVELAERLEEFEDVRRTLKQKTHTLTPVRRPEVRGSNQAENFRKFDNHNTRRTGNFNPEKRYLDTPPSRDFDRRHLGDVTCHSLDHLSFNCPKAMKEIKREQSNPQVQSCSVTPQK